MKKSLITLAILAAAGAAQAQSSVTIYGSADISYVKSSGTSITMSGGAERDLAAGRASDNTYLGFLGTEDLGGGLKATFQLEKRFNLANGASSGYGDFEGAANVGLSGNFGQFRFGRVNELSTETYRRLDPFDQNGVAGALTTIYRGDDEGGRLSYTARYDSPSLNGFKLGASYTVKNGPTPIWPGPDNAGYAVSGTYANGPIYLVANYNKAVNSNDSYNWNAGGFYELGALKLSLGFEKTSARNSGPSEVKLQSWLAGASYRIGNGTINAAYSYQKQERTPDYFTYDKYAIGYTHDLSKRTSLYANYSNIKITSVDAQDGTEKGSVNQWEAGLTHKF